MKEYFKLQFRLVNRKLLEIGIHPVIACFLVISIFILLATYLFAKTEFAPYIFIFISLSFTAKLSDNKRNDFLKTIFKEREYLIVRMIENSIVASPFLLYLLYEQHYIIIAVLTFFSLSLVIINFRTSLDFTIPTPFSKRPFEFTAGFRDTFYLFPIIYILAISSIVTDNFNLGIFSIILVFIVCLSFYLKPETEYFVWSFNLSPSGFLLNKIKTAIQQSSLLVMPIVVPLALFNFNNIWYVLLFLLLGYSFLIFMVLVKYAAYPEEIGLIHGLFFAICLVFPPILLLMIPFLFNQSVHRLKHLLK